MASRDPDSKSNESHRSFKLWECATWAYIIEQVWLQGLKERDWLSPADYDADYSIEAKTDGSVRHVYVVLNNSPGKAHEGASEEVSCKVVTSASRRLN